MPEKEISSCWWLINPKDESTSTPTLLCRSLTCMTLELNQNRIASTQKIKQTYERRAEQNARVVEMLHDHIDMWKFVHGVDPMRLFRPRAPDIELAKQAVNRLKQLTEADGRDGLAEFTDEAAKGVDLLSSLEWDDIRIEKFSLTPLAVFVFYKKEQAPRKILNIFRIRVYARSSLNW